MERIVFFININGMVQAAGLYNVKFIARHMFTLSHHPQIVYMYAQCCKSITISIQLLFLFQQNSKVPNITFVSIIDYYVVINSYNICCCYSLLLLTMIFRAILDIVQQLQHYVYNYVAQFGIEFYNKMFSLALNSMLYVLHNTSGSSVQVQQLMPYL